MPARREFLTTLGAGLAAAASPRLAAGGPGGKPNILLVIGDDMTWHDCEPYGSKQVKTPHMARLARQGIRFDAMFTATAMCAPTRQQLYTGLFPVRNGAYPNHSGVYPTTRSLPHYLEALGYRVGLIGKTHFKPRRCYPFERLKGGPSNTKAIAAFVNRDKTQPYCLIVASHEPHKAWTKGPQDAYQPDAVRVPPYLVDTAVTRREMTKYFAEITHVHQHHLPQRPRQRRPRLLDRQGQDRPRRRGPRPRPRLPAPPRRGTLRPDPRPLGAAQRRRRARLRQGQGHPPPAPRRLDGPAGRPGHRDRAPGPPAPAGRPQEEAKEALTTSQTTGTGFQSVDEGIPRASPRRARLRTAWR